MTNSDSITVNAYIAMVVTGSSMARQTSAPVKILSMGGSMASAGFVHSGGLWTETASNFTIGDATAPNAGSMIISGGTSRRKMILALLLRIC